MSASPVDGAKAHSDRPAYPGEKFGLPEKGPGSVAGMGRRLGALLIDWVVCTLIALAAFHDQYWTLAVFAAQDYLLTALTGLTLGKRLTGIRVARLDGRPVGFLWGLVRTRAAADRGPAAGRRPRPARPARPGRQHHRHPALSRALGGAGQRA